MNKQQKIGILLSYAIIVINLFIGIIYTPILLRLLGQNEYGVYQLAVSLVNYLELFSLGFSSAYVRFYMLYEKTGKQGDIAKLNGMFLYIFTILGTFALITGILLYFNSGLVFGNQLSVNELKVGKNLIGLLVVNIFITFITSVFNGIVIAREAFVFQKTVQLLMIILAPCLVIPALYYTGKTCIMGIVPILVSLGTLAVYVTYCIRTLRAKFNLRCIDIPLLKSLFAFSSFIFLNMVIDQINWNVDKFLLGRFHGASQVAIYGIAAQINMIFMQLSTAIATIFIPKVNRAVTNGKDNEVNELFVRVGRIQFLLLCLVASGFVAFGKYFMILWAGKEYGESYYVTLLLIMPAIIPFIQNIGIEILRAKNKHQFRSVVYIIIAILNVLISIPLSRKYGSLGAAMGTAISLIIGNGIIINWYYNKIGIRVKVFWIQIFKFIPSLIIPFALMYVIMKFINLDNIVEFVVGIFIYCLVYLVSIYFMGLDEVEKNVLKNTFKIRL